MLKNVRLFLPRALCLIFALLFALSLDSSAAFSSEEVFMLNEATNNVRTLNAETQQPTLTTSSSKSSKNPIYEYDNGDTLAEVADSLRLQKFESSAGFDDDGEKLFNYTSYITNHTYLTLSTVRSFLATSGTLFIHNHPSSTGFSAQDLYVSARYQIPRVMIISESYVYTLESISGDWCDPDALRDFYTTTYDEWFDYASDYLQDQSFNRAEVLAAPEREDDGSLEWFCENEARQAALNDAPKVVIRLGLWLSNRALTDTAAEFDLKYQRTPFEEFDFDDPSVFQASEVIEIAKS